MKTFTFFNLLSVFGPLRLAICGLLLIPAAVFAADDQETSGKTVDLAQVSVLGIKLMETEVKQVRDHLWAIGGFTQARSTLQQVNVDRFFSRSRWRDSYYVEFRYNSVGKIMSVKRLYRPYSTETVNRRSALTTREIALQLVKELGQPAAVVSRGWGGSLRYPSYRWEDDKMEVILDREGGEKLGNIFVEYRVKPQTPEQSPYYVEAQPPAGQRRI
ncbi:hypothetical protein [Thiomicrorhabdus cannonii]|uniref:hypothetical protein n=1 Tax=Thiomicrorhabdus cannonii TaxID=2748011 RepID=UPI0015C1C084|nr:hypothetical protein [Thiomicrorhabdus cannonii]